MKGTALALKNKIVGALHSLHNIDFWRRRWLISLSVAYLGAIVLGLWLYPTSLRGILPIAGNNPKTAGTAQNPNTPAFAGHSTNRGGNTTKHSSTSAPDSGSSNASSQLAQPGGQSAITAISQPVLWDYFNRSDRNLNKDNPPSGSAYEAVGQDTAVIRNLRYVRDDASAYGAAGSSILMMPHTSAPTIVSAQFVFTPGQSDNENAVVAACAKGLGSGSVQFAVWPDRWQMFTVIPRATPDAQGNTVIYTTLGSGKISPALAVDGQTIYTTTMTYDEANSSVSVTWGNNQTETFTSADPSTGINANWGTYAVAQIRHPGSTDGDIQFTGFGSN